MSTQQKKLINALEQGEIKLNKYADKKNGKDYTIELLHTAQIDSISYKTLIEFDVDSFKLCDVASDLNIHRNDSCIGLFKKANKIDFKKIIITYLKKYHAN